MYWRLNDLDRDAWEAAARDAPFEQSWLYGAVAESFGARLARWRLVSGGQTVALAQGIERGIGPFRVLWFPRGVHGVATAEMTDLRRALPGHPFVLSPEAGRIVRQVADRAELVLTSGLRAGLGKKWRNRLSAAERAGLQVCRMRGLSDWLMDCELRQRRSRGYRALPALWVKRVAALDPDCVETLIAWKDGVRVAGVTCLRHGRQMRYELGHTTETGRKLSAHNLLLWRAMRDAEERGDARMDLGIVDATRLPGLTRFKLGTGARQVAAPPMRLLTPWAQASDGSQSTMDGKATSVAMVTASATKNGITPLKTS
ncbi:GNAT family N-acetyltransferase [Maribius pontilimi]|uniref:GNAT family N-acetyltransferase n=1 Tax=Palleronia pontilimi TaxID=1964209 RepID=A0A934IEN2_9RHOB|nr:GNAT family N-acetyltransferase [Palleronia pontilimi]MBJ3763042.1 GNAT family N-acetyltransferase [Palleronia pontilimi]